MSQATVRPPRPAVVVERAFGAIGTTNLVLVTDPTAADEAERVARDMVATLDRVASRFRDDSEVMSLARAAEDGPATVAVSSTLARCIGAARRAAELTGGLVDPTVGRAVEATGYDTDYAVLRARTELRDGATAGRVPGWRQIRIDEAAGTVSVPRRCLLDFGSSAKADAADRIAQRLSQLLPGGFLVNLGGDVAVSGRMPSDGWRVGLEDAWGRTRQVVVSRGQALATSSTRRRTWATPTGRRHHIVDPRTGDTASALWAEVTCAGASALEANAASTAAVVLGEDAPEWLTRHGIPARLDPVAGPPVTTAGWPDPEVAA